MTINNPVVLINQGGKDTDYIVAVTNGSDNYQDMVLGVRVSQHPPKDDFNATLESVCWYMAKEIVRLKGLINES